MVRYWGQRLFLIREYLAVFGDGQLGLGAVSVRQFQLQVHNYIQYFLMLVEGRDGPVPQIHILAAECI
jgi:hypothetical protein